MKTDRFADIIRRKLDSIRPDFSERDWDRMQATLKQAGVTPDPTSFAAHPFAAPAAKLAVVGAIGTAVFLTTTIWQHYELKHLHQNLQEVTQKANQLQTLTPRADSLTQTVGGSEPVGQVGKTMQQTPDQPANAVSDTRKTTTGNIPRDTVYIDRYVMVPSTSPRRQTTATAQPADQLSQRTVDKRLSSSDRSSESTPSTNPPEERIASQRTGKPAELSTPTPVDLAPEATAVKETGNVAVDKSGASPSVSPDKTTGRSMTSAKAVNASTVEPVNGIATDNSTAVTVNDRTGSGQKNTDRTPYRAPSQADRSPSFPTEETAIPKANESARSVTTYEQLTALPMQNNTVRWDQLLAQRAKRMRPARTTIVSGQPQSPARSKPITPFFAGVRVGAGTNLSSQLSTYGAYSEVLLGRHFALSVGINKGNFAALSFRDEDDYDRVNHEDFRQQFARFVDMHQAILNIKSTTTRVQMPIQLSYRIPLNQAFTLAPVVGTNLTIQNMESLSFISLFQIRPSLFELKTFDRSINRPIDLFNSMTLGTNVEWHQHHWAVQAGPVVTIPFQTTSFPVSYCQDNVSVGLRARLFYQF
ncbi:hypothetical protein WBJ53_14445 [Spirosoma sp. SC4-14]|uniref:hypothetical protein n=1 Tax=Spirosoma sp. SC4-14 TaxID=3128900 RepID=UPI0030D1E555